MNVFKGCKGSAMDVRTVHMIQGVDGHQGLKIQKWFQKFVKWWLQTIEWPWNWWRIDCTLRGRWSIKFFI